MFFSGTNCPSVCVYNIKKPVQVQAQLSAIYLICTALMKGLGLITQPAALTVGLSH